MFCWAPRKSIYQKDKPDGCFAKEGNPFGPFWDYSKVDFVGEIYYGTEIQGGFHVSSPAVAEQWFKRRVYSNRDLANDDFYAIDFCLSDSDSTA